MTLAAAGLLVPTILLAPAISNPADEWMDETFEFVEPEPGQPPPVAAVSGTDTDLLWKLEYRRSKRVIAAGSVAMAVGVALAVPSAIFLAALFSSDYSYCAEPGDCKFGAVLATPLTLISLGSIAAGVTLMVDGIRMRRRLVDVHGHTPDSSLDSSLLGPRGGSLHITLSF